MIVAFMWLSKLGLLLGTNYDDSEAARGILDRLSSAGFLKVLLFQLLLQHLCS